MSKKRFIRFGVFELVAYETFRRRGMLKTGQRRRPRDTSAGRTRWSKPMMTHHTRTVFETTATPAFTSASHTFGSFGPSRGAAAIP
jgi:hypothetical protein